MKLSEKLLNTLVDWRPPARQLLTVSDESTAGWTIALTADHADKVGCVIWELVLQRVTPEPWDAAALHGQTDGIADRVTSLLEPLKLLEVDALRLEALLRSDGPAKRGEEVFYYEAKLQSNNSITLRRFHACTVPGNKREQVSFTLTHEAIAKLVDDMTA